MILQGALVAAVFFVLGMAAGAVCALAIVRNVFEYVRNEPPP